MAIPDSVRREFEEALDAYVVKWRKGIAKHLRTLPSEALANPPRKMAKAFNVNDHLLERAVHHHVGVQKYGAKIGADLQQTLENAEHDIRDAVNQYSDKNGKIKTRDLTALIAAIYQIEQDYQGELDDQLRADLEDFVDYEVAVAKTQLEDELPDDVTVNDLDPDDVDSILTDVAFQGRYIDDWVSDFSDADYKRVRDAVQAGVQSGSTAETILAGLAGGAFLVGARQLENVTRGIFNGVANWARLLTYEANPDLVSHVQWVAVLDADTCPICSDLDGEIFALDDVDPPPIHLSCRCSIVPVIVSFERLARVSRLIHSHPKRHLFTGKPATKLRYATWLRRQNKATHDEALGPTRAKLFREGGLTINRFVNHKGPDGKPHILTLDELRKRDAAAFRRAGL